MHLKIDIYLGVPDLWTHSLPVPTSLFSCSAFVCSFFQLLIGSLFHCNCWNDYRPLYWDEKQHQVQKVKCIVHYFERITSKRPIGSVSFERKVLHVDNSDHGLAYSSTTYWRSSTTPLCSFEVMFDANVNFH